MEGRERGERERSGELLTFRGSGVGLLPVAGVLWEGGVERTILSSLTGPG